MISNRMAILTTILFASAAIPASAATPILKTKPKSSATVSKPASTPQNATAKDSTSSQSSTSDAEDDKPFLEAFPNLKTYLYSPPKSGFYLGFGISPVGVLGNELVFGANFFQIHYLSRDWDLELLNASYSFTHAQSSELNSTAFTFRGAVKFRITHVISIGPLAGFQFITFPGVGSKIYNPNNNQETQEFEPFSSSGVIYGGMVSEIFKYKKKYKLQVNELFYQQTYSAKRTAQNWTYLFQDSTITNNRNLISAGLVSLIEISFLY